MTSYGYEKNVALITHIDFDVLSNKEILKLSVFRNTPYGVSQVVLYNKSGPAEGSLLDPRMGPTGHNSVCETCGLSLTYCVGHFGHETLAKPMYHVGYIRHLQKILEVVCPYCSKILINKNNEEFIEWSKMLEKKNLFTNIKDLARKTKNCPNCGSPVPKIILEIKQSSSTINMIMETDIETTKEEGIKKEKQENRRIMTTTECYNILKAISDDDVYLLGMDPKRTRPEDLIIKNFPIVPIAVRPSAKLDALSTGTNEDDLTRLLMEIVKRNVKLLKDAGGNEKNIRTDLELLQYHLANYFSNEVLTNSKTLQKNAKILKSLSSRLKGKEGRFRGSLMGRNLNRELRF